jgi:hypothetical protein
MPAEADEFARARPLPLQMMKEEVDAFRRHVRS